MTRIRTREGTAIEIPCEAGHADDQHRRAMTLVFCWCAASSRGLRRSNALDG
jgi:hypothetical protein